MFLWLLVCCCTRYGGSVPNPSDTEGTEEYFMSKTDTEVGVSEQQVKEIKEDAKNRITAVQASAKE